MKKFIILLLAAACGVALSQFPEFAQQYRQRVGGAVDELSKVVTQFDAAASDAGLAREEALKRYAETNDDFLNRRGSDMTATITRFEYLRQHLASLTNAKAYERLWVFAKDRDMELSKATLDDFEPAVPVTAEGLILGGAGLLGGWAIFSFLLSPFGRRRSRNQRRRR